MSLWVGAAVVVAVPRAGRAAAGALGGREDVSSVEAEIPLAPVHGGTLSPRWAEIARSCAGWVPSLCPSPPLSWFCGPHPMVTSCPSAHPP